MCAKIAKMSDEDIDLYSNKLSKELGFSMSTINSLIKSFKSEDLEVVDSNEKFDDDWDIV